jgi:biotin operon repressor
VANWRARATTDAAVIEQWWTIWPNANIAVVTGEDLVVVDVDGEDGMRSLEELRLPQTASVITGRGRHLYFQGSRATAVEVYPGIDIRGEGGYVVAPPSLHASGARYSWRQPLSEGIERLPDWFPVPGRKSASKASATTTHSPTKPDNQEPFALTLRKGERNDGLYRRACSMRAIGMTASEIAGALRVSNRELCRPRLKAAEVVAIAESAGSRPSERRVDKRLLALALGPYAVALYVALQSHCQGNTCFPSQARLADLTGMSGTSVKKATEELERAELVHVDRVPRESNFYTMIDPDNNARSGK